MPDVRLLREELEQVITKRVDLKNKYTGREWPAEAKREDKDLIDRGLKLEHLIEEEQQKERDRDFDRLTGFLNDPYGRPMHPVNADDDGRKQLMAAGWEIKNSMVLIPTSTGDMVPFVSEKVLFGPVPRDADGARFYKQTRASVQPGYREAYERFLTLCAGNRTESMAMSLLNGDQQKALSEGLDESGGLLVPPDVQAEIMSRVAAKSVMRRLARVVNTSRDRVQWPRVLPHPTSPSLYSSGFVGGWVGETPAFTETDPGWGQFEISIKKLRVATKLSNDLIADAATNILAWLAENGAENMRLVEDQGFIAGTGMLDPLGILNTPGVSTVDVEGSTANTISNSTSNTGSAPKLIDLAYAVPSQYAEGATWLMRRSIEGDIRKLVDADGRFLWPALSGSALAGTPRSMLDAPVENSEFVPDDGVDGNKVLIYGDFSHYIIAQRAQITSVVLRERFADTDQTGIILFERVGGALSNPDAIRFGIV